MSIQDKFEAYHGANPHVYDLFVKFARQVKASGLQRYSIWAVGNRVRWHYLFDISPVTGETFKISNNYFSRYARRIMQQETDLKGFFVTKRLKGGV